MSDATTHDDGGKGGGGGGWTPPPTPPWEVPGEPYLTCAQIGERLNRAKRIVQIWFTDKGCPHQLTHRGKRPTYVSQLSVVKAWLAGQGMDVVKGVTDPRRTASPKTTPTQAAEVSTAEVNAAVGLDDFDDQPLLQEQIQRLLQQESERRGDVDFDGLLSRARTAFDSLLSNPPANDADTGNKQRYASAMQSADRTIRALVQARHESQIRRAKWIWYDDAITLTTEMGDVFKSVFATLRADLVRRMNSALVGLIPPEKMEAAKREIGVVCRDATDAAQTELSLGVVRMAQGLEVGAKAAVTRATPRRAGAA